MEIQEERAGDIEFIRRVNEEAFERSDEADLVDALRRDADPFISLVALDGDAVVGHIVFTAMTLADASESLRIAGLAPMAVAPSHQNRGIGSKLVEAGLARCRDSGFQAVAVLGHPEFYPRFGFLPASSFGLRSEYDVPDEVFMAMELEEKALDGVSGLLRYHAAFADIS